MWMNTNAHTKVGQNLPMDHGSHWAASYESFEVNEQKILDSYIECMILALVQKDGKDQMRRGRRGWGREGRRERRTTTVMKETKQTEQQVDEDGQTWLMLQNGQVCSEAHVGAHLTSHNSLSQIYLEPFWSLLAPLTSWVLNLSVPPSLW